MIFYFTGTGNSLAAAQTIARATGDMLADIGASYKRKDFDFTLEQGEQLGFVFPTYYWTTPAIVDTFVKLARFRTGNREAFAPGYCFAVVSCGRFVGNAARVFETRLLASQGINLDASFSVRSVGNCTFLYAPAQGERREQLLANAELEARRVAERVRQRERVHAEHRNPVGVLLSAAFERDEKPCPTASFHTLPTCIHCGRCAELCPTNTITLIEGAPPLGRNGLHSVLGLPAPLPHQLHPIRQAHRNPRPLRQPRPRRKEGRMNAAATSQSFRRRCRNPLRAS